MYLPYFGQLLESKKKVVGVLAHHSLNLHPMALQWSEQTGRALIQRKQNKRVTLMRNDCLRLHKFAYGWVGAVTVKL